jgi:predicted lipoprotein with Yx(FWY)xxD motif
MVCVRTVARLPLPVTAAHRLACGAYPAEQGRYPGSSGYSAASPQDANGREKENPCPSVDRWRCSSCQPQPLLGRVFRAGVGWQVTYAGHPLYLFDQMPGAVTGEGWFEPGLPPWHGVWWLMSPGGHPVPWAGTLTTAKVGGQTVLAEPMLTAIGWVNFPLYTFSADGADQATCTALSACARAWPRAYTNGSPGYSGVPASGIGTVAGPNGLTQITWNSRPLYLFSNEALAPMPNGGAAPAGNGNGIKAFGGTFSLVVNP